MKKVAFLIPSFNRGERLFELLNSINNLEDTDTFVCFDSMTDTNYERVKNNFPWVKVFRKENGGVSDTRNFLFNNSKSEYVLFIDDDDLLHDEFKKWLKCNKDFDKDLYKFKRQLFNESELLGSNHYPFSRKTLRKTDKLAFAQVSTWLIKRTAYIELGLKFNVGHISEDRSFNADIDGSNKKAYIAHANATLHRITGADKLTNSYTSVKTILASLKEVDYLVKNISKRYYREAAYILINQLWDYYKDNKYENFDLYSELQKRKLIVYKKRISLIIGLPFYYKFKWFARWLFKK